MDKGLQVFLRKCVDTAVQVFPGLYVFPAGHVYLSQLLSLSALLLPKRPFPERERPFFKINKSTSTFLRLRRGFSLVEAGGIEPPSDMGRPWRRYRLSFLLIVVREAAENGPSLSKTSGLFHFGKVRREAEHPPEMTSPAGRQRSPSFNVAGLSRQCVVIVDVYRLVRMFNEDYGHNSACSSRSSACRRSPSAPGICC